MSDTVNDYLLSGGIPACKFPEIGTVCKGTIVTSEVTQQTDYGTGVLKFYDDGKPMMQVIITLQTEEHDPNIDGDTGLRKLYVRGQMTAAVREALRTSGSKLAVGGTLAVQYEKDKQSEKRGFNAQKVYRAQYQPPSADAAANDLLGATAAAADPPSPDGLI